MLEKTLEELAETEGGKAIIKKKERHTTIGRIGFIICAACIICILSGFSYHNSYNIYCVILIIYVLYFRMSSVKINFLNVECDPFKAEEAYAYYYLAYAKEKVADTPSKWIFHTYISRSIMLQGNYERAFSILNEIDMDELEQSLPLVKVSYYDSIRMYYMYKNDMEKLTDIRNLLFQMRNVSYGSRYQKMVDQEIECINLYLSLQQNEFDDYERISSKPIWKEAVSVQKVFHRCLDAKFHMKQNDLEAAREDCQYVIENGNKLCYVEEAKELLRKIDGEKNGEKD